MNAAILLPVLARHDAVGNDALAMARQLRERGIETRLFCEASIGMDEEVHKPADLLDFAGGSGDVVIYHFSVGWPAALDILGRARGFRAVRYHNITPPHFFTDYAPDYEVVCGRGRAEIAQIAALGCELYLGDSRYNLDELVAHGVPESRGAVFAPFHQVEQLVQAEADLALLDDLNDGSRNILMVGRIAPNKAHLELLDAFAAYVDGYGDPARLLVVGKFDPRLQSYVDALRDRVESHGLGHRVWWLDSLNAAQLKAAYIASHVFMTLSHHEGFCVPLIEAMALGVPIVAHGSSAIPETVGGGGVVWRQTDPWLYAASAARIVGDEDFRSRLRSVARNRYETEFSPAVIGERFLAAMEPIL